MGSDSELSIEDQTSIIKMLESNDQETTRLALSVVDKYPRPGIMVNKSTPLGDENNHLIVMCLSFQQWIRRAVNRELLHPNRDYWIRDNMEMLKRLQNY